jgi:hypothetical protein
MVQHAYPNSDRADWGVSLLQSCNTALPSGHPRQEAYMTMKQGVLAHGTVCKQRIDIN